MLLRVYAKMDSSNKIALPRGIRKALEIKAGEKLELTIVPKGVLLRSVTLGCRRDVRKVATFGIGMNKVKKLLVTKVRRCLR